MAEERWYIEPCKNLIRLTSYAILAVGIGYGFKACREGWEHPFIENNRIIVQKEIENEKLKAQKELLRLEAVRDITYEYSRDMSPGELENYIKELGLDR